MEREGSVHGWFSAEESCREPMGSVVYDERSQFSLVVASVMFELATGQRDVAMTMQHDDEVTMQFVAAVTRMNFVEPEVSVVLVPCVVELHFYCLAVVIDCLPSCSRAMFRVHAVHFSMLMADLCRLAELAASKPKLALQLASPFLVYFSDCFGELHVNYQLISCSSSDLDWLTPNRRI